MVLLSSAKNQQQQIYNQNFINRPNRIDSMNWKIGRHSRGERNKTEKRFVITRTHFPSERMQAEEKCLR